MYMYMYIYVILYVYITQTTYPVDLAMTLSLDNYYYNCFTLQMQEVDSKAAHYYAEVGTHVQEK